MGLVIFQTKSKGLCNLLLLILVIKEDFALWRKALDAERSVTNLILDISFWIEITLICENLLDFDELDLVWQQFLSHVHLIIRELCQISCEMSLFEDIRYNIHEFKLSLIPNLCSIVLIWQLKSSQLVIIFICLIVNDCNKFKFVAVSLQTYWTLENGVILERNILA